MNPGYFAFLCYWFLFLLIWSELIKLNHQFHLKQNRLLWIVIVAGLTTFIVVPVSDLLRVNVGGWGIPAALSVYLWMKQEEYERIHLFSAGALIGMSVLLARGAFYIDPVLLVTEEKYLLSLLTAFLSLIAARKIAHHFFVITMGLIVQETLYTWFIWDRIREVQFGDGWFRDIWWLSLITAGTLQKGIDGVRFTFNRLRELRKIRETDG